MRSVEGERVWKSEISGYLGGSRKGPGGEDNKGSGGGMLQGTRPLGRMGGYSLL